MPDLPLAELAVELLDACPGPNAAVSPLNVGMAVALAGRLSSEGVPVRWSAIAAAEDAAMAGGTLLAAAAFVPEGRLMEGPFPTGPHDSVFPFRDEADARARCDAWCDAATGGLLPTGPQPKGDPDSATIASVAAFKGKWETPFEVASTRPAPFAHADGERPVAMMHATRTTRYASGDGWKAVSLPYEGGLRFVGLVRDDGVPDPTALLGLLGTHGLPDHGDAAVALPRHRVETEKLDLLGTSVGDEASGLSLDLVARTEGTSLTEAKHTCRVATDEEGTVAVAFTEMTFSLACCMPTEPFRIAFDRPFAFAIVAGDVPVFVGRVGEPEAWTE